MIPFTNIFGEIKPRVEIYSWVIPPNNNSLSGFYIKESAFAEIGTNIAQKYMFLMYFLLLGFLNVLQVNTYKILQFNDLKVHSRACAF